MRELALRTVLIWAIAATAFGLLWSENQKINSNMLFCQKADYEMFFNPQLGHWDARFMGCSRY